VNPCGLQVFLFKAAETWLSQKQFTTCGSLLGFQPEKEVNSKIKTHFFAFTCLEQFLYLVLTTKTKFKKQSINIKRRLSGWHQALRKHAADRESAN